jgi:hypothetical protein
MEIKILEQIILFNDHISQIISILQSKSSSNWQLIIGGFIGFISALFAPILIVPIKYFFYGPKLKLKFNNDDYAYKTEIQKNNKTVHYIRAEVINTGCGIAKQCRAYLVNVQKMNPSGKFEPTHYKDSLQLSWAAKKEEKDKYNPLDLSKNISQFINVIIITEPSEYKVQIQEDLYSYKSLLEGEKGTFKYTIHVSGDNVKPVLINIITEWNGNWDTFKIN